MPLGKVLVTGAAGFMGSHVAAHCLALGMDVVAVDDLSGGHRRNVPPGATFVEGDLRSVEFVESLWRRGPFDFVYHLAAYAAEGLSHFVRRFNYETNLLASVNLLNAAVNHGTKCFVFTSSIAVYGRNQVPMREDLTPHPEDPYGISKLAVELDLAAAHAMFGLDSIVFRPHNVYGERQNLSDKYRNVIAGRRAPSRMSTTSLRSSRGRRSCGRPTTKSSMWGRTSRTRFCPSPRKYPAAWTSSFAYAIFRRATRSSTPTPITPRSGAC